MSGKLKEPPSAPSDTLGFQHVGNIFDTGQDAAQLGNILVKAGDTVTFDDTVNGAGAKATVIGCLNWGTR